MILTYYGVLFVLALPFVGLSARALGLLAAGWLVVAPVLSHLAAPVPARAAVLQPHLGPARRRPRRPARRAHLHRLLPGRAVAGLRARRDGRRPPRPHLASYGGGAGRRGSGRRGGRHRGLAGPDRHDRRSQEALLTDPPAPDADAAALLDRIADGPARHHAHRRRVAVAAGRGPAHGHALRPRCRPSARRSSSIGLALLALVASSGPLATRATAVFFGAGTMTLTLYSLHVRGPLARPAARRAARQLPLPRPAPAGDRAGVRRHRAAAGRSRRWSAPPPGSGRRSRPRVGAMTTRWGIAGTGAMAEAFLARLRARAGRRGGGHRVALARAGRGLRARRTASRARTPTPSW